MPRTLPVKSPGRAVYRDDRRKDGIDYEIIVYAASGGLYGTWGCLACNLTGVNQMFSATIEEAAKVAEKGLIAHHQAAHRPQSP